MKLRNVAFALSALLCLIASALLTVGRGQAWAGVLAVTHQCTIQVWGDAHKVGGNWLPWADYPLGRPHFFHRHGEYQDEDDRKNLRTEWGCVYFAGFTLLFDDVPDTGEVDVPTWFVALVFALYPARRTYKWWRSRNLKPAGFEPVIEPRQVNA